MSQCLFIVIFGIILLACVPNRQDAIGHYVNTAEPGAVHYVDLNSNGTFHHYYKGEFGKHSNTGRWVLNDDNCSISFEKWTDFGQRADLGCADGCSISVQLYWGELRFNYDLPELNFRRE